MVKGKISGTFVDFSEQPHKDRELLAWSLTDWKEEMQDMLDAGIDTVILARTMRFGAVYYHSHFFETHLERDYIKPFMEAAGETGMNVFISGMISDHFFRSNDKDFIRMMQRDVFIYEKVLTELLDIYAEHPHIRGIYISHEADNENMASPARFLAAQNFFANLYSALKKETSLPVLSSPFFTKSASPKDLADFWNRFLDRPMFDILAMQDGIGCNRDIDPIDIPLYYNLLAPIFKSKGIEFWNNVETFSFNPGYRESGFDRSKIWLKTAPIDRVELQYEAGKPFVSRTITWEFGHFLGRRQAGKDFYQTFKQWNVQEDREKI
ncbi:DUF4434 domain-containing protein [Treponema sp.]